MTRLQLSTDELRLGLLSHGATVQSLECPDRDGTWADVMLGFDDPSDYEDDHPFLGATVGRYANRIAAGRFTLDGVRHQVPVNDGPNALHGGPEHFGRREWEVLEHTATSATLRLVSDDGDMGFPGRLEVTTTWSVEGAVVREHLAAVTDAPTVVNLTNHAYVNLHGDARRTIADHVITIPADEWIPVDDTAIPLADSPVPVAGSYDLRDGVVIGDDIEFDHTWVLGIPGELKTAAIVDDPCSGRRLTVRTTEPGVQFYSGNVLDGSFLGKAGAPLVKRAGLCLETQHFPDSPNRPDFPSTVLRPGERFESVTEWELTPPRQ
ncbi:aldose epimerase family protein [Nocardioides sp. Kera G14]|uniref:aldose epimerase family protein n=1 Tax=Nocardioides sp. Kera G14 TaxID=2884264 RepID=UPI001D1011CB|nr:aldose epimerase family protein [Nocardioides sp. Kera G14]UDY24952.1 galactose mutarotase [Nocardioides sp. Kera G14]